MDPPPTLEGEGVSEVIPPTGSYGLLQNKNDGIFQAIFSGGVVVRRPLFLGSDQTVLTPLLHWKRLACGRGGGTP